MCVQCVHLMVDGRKDVHLKPKQTVKVAVKKPKRKECNLYAKPVMFLCNNEFKMPFFSCKS